MNAQKLAGLVATALILAACGDDNDPSQPNPEPNDGRRDAGPMDAGGRSSSDAGPSQDAQQAGSSGSRAYRPLLCGDTWETFPDGWLPCELCTRANCCEEANRCGSALDAFPAADCTGSFSCVHVCLNEGGGTDADGGVDESLEGCLHACRSDAVQWHDGWDDVAPLLAELYSCLEGAPGIVRTADDSGWELDDSGEARCFEQCGFNVPP
jgi:hypothetical protein